MVFYFRPIRAVWVSCWRALARSRPDASLSVCVSVFLSVCLQPAFFSPLILLKRRISSAPSQIPVSHLRHPDSSCSLSRFLASFPVTPSFPDSPSDVVLISLIPTFFLPILIVFRAEVTAAASCAPIPIGELEFLLQSSFLSTKDRFNIIQLGSL